MSQLKQSTIAKIYHHLDSGDFTQFDFDVQTPEQGKPLVEIKLRAAPRYTFVITEEIGLSTVAEAVAVGKGRFIPTTTESPGDFKLIEKNQFPSLNNAIDRIPAWLANVYAELRVRNILSKEIDLLRQQLEEHLSSHPHAPDDFFSKDDLRILEDRLETLMQGFERLENEHKITQEDLKALRQEIEKIKSTASDLPKGMWASLAKGRILKIAKAAATSAEGRQLLLEAGRKFLLGDNTPKA